MKGLAHISAFFIFLTMVSGFVCHAQKSKREVGAQAVWGVGSSDQENALRYIVEGKDTIFIANGGNTTVWCIISARHTLMPWWHADSCRKPTAP